VAALPKIVAETKRVVEGLDIEHDVYVNRIGEAEERIPARVKAKLAAGAYVDKFETAEGSLRRAATLDELDRAWNTCRQMPLVAPSFRKLRNVYHGRKRAIANGSTHKPRTRVTASTDVPF
jgi:hypothetical protein